MTIFQAFLLGIIQGITEFLPISSSGHLVIIPSLLGWNFPSDQIFPFDVLIQISTLIAVIAFYWEDLIQISRAMLVGIKNKKPFAEIQARTGWLAILATIPAGAVGLLFKKQIETAFSRPDLASALLIVTAIFLFFSEKIGNKTRNITSLNWLDSIVMGIFQAVSIFPGISRSGSTISGGLVRNLDRKTAGQFTFLMAIPIMGAAGLLSLVDLVMLPNLFQFLPIMIIGFITSGIVGFLSIRWLLKYINNHSLIPFAIYCFILGSGSLLLSGLNIINSVNNEGVAAKSTYHLTYSPSVEWMVPIINTCSDKFSDASVLLNQLDETNFSTKSDIHFSYNEFETNSPYTYQLGIDSLSIGVNQNSPINHLTIESVQAIYRGEITTVSDLFEKCENCISNENLDLSAEKPFRIWGYPQNTLLEDSIKNIFQIQYFSPDMYLAPNPALMEQAVLLEDTAIGIFPTNSINNELRVIPLNDLPNEHTQLIILASSEAELDLYLKGFLECVQDKLIN